MNHDAKLVIKFLASARNASYCELLRVSNLKFAHVNIYLRWFTKKLRFQMVSESFRGFQKVLGFKFHVSEGFRKNNTLKTKTTFLKTIAITIAIAMSKGSGWKPY